MRTLKPREATELPKGITLTKKSDSGIQIITGYLLQDYLFYFLSIPD